VPFTINTLQSITQEYIAPKVYDNTFKGSPFLYWLKENARLSLRGGLEVRASIIKQQFNNEWYSGTDAATLEVLEPFTTAKYDWKWGRVPFVLTEEDIDKNGGETGIVDIVDSCEQVATLTMVELLSTGLFGTNSSNSKQMDGLQNMGAASGTAYAGLTDTDFVSPATWLMNIHTLLTTNTLADQDMRIMRGAVTRGRARPNLGLCNFPVYSKIWDIADAEPLVVGGDVAKIGFDHVLFETMPIMADEHSPGTGVTDTDNWLFFLNTDYIKLVMHEAKAFSTRVYAPIPQQEVYIGKVFFGGNLVTTQRRAHSVNKVIKPSL